MFKLETLFSGLIPCSVLSVYSDAHTRAVMADVKVEKTVGAYKQGDTLSAFFRKVVRRTGVSHCGFILVTSIRLDELKIK